MMTGRGRAMETLLWQGDVDGHLRMIDQTRLPGEFVEFDCHRVQDVWEAIKQLKVRGAPAIGIAAAYGVCLAAQQAVSSQRRSSGGEGLGASGLLGNESPDGRESILGAESHESDGIERVARRSIKLAAGVAGRGTANSR